MVRREVAIEEMVKGERLFSGRYGVDGPRVGAVANRAFDRTADLAASQTEHWILGTDDLFFPIGHGEALARAIPTARLIPLDGSGISCRRLKFGMSSSTRSPAYRGPGVGPQPSEPAALSGPKVAGCDVAGGGG